MEKVGVIQNYFTKIGVAVLNITDGEIKIGNRIKIKGSTTDFDMVIESMQIDRKDIEIAKKGQQVGLKVKQRVRPGDRVYILE